jgi:NTP pyrophosphatase (non-canonical NTP hydrolase)
MARVVAPRLRVFLNLMYAKLRENDHKGDWLYTSNLHELWACLEREIEELAEALTSGLSSKEVADEAADVANFAMMIADFVGGLREDTSPVSSEAPTKVDWQPPSVRELQLFPAPESTERPATFESDEITSKIYGGPR